MAFTIYRLYLKNFKKEKLGSAPGRGFRVSPGASPGGASPGASPSPIRPEVGITWGITEVGGAPGADIKVKPQVSLTSPRARATVHITSTTMSGPAGGRRRSRRLSTPPLPLASRRWTSLQRRGNGSRRLRTPCSASTPAQRVPRSGRSERPPAAASGGGTQLQQHELALLRRASLYRLRALRSASSAGAPWHTCAPHFTSIATHAPQTTCMRVPRTHTFTLHTTRHRHRTAYALLRLLPSTHAPAHPPACLTGVTGILV